MCEASLTPSSPPSTPSRTQPHPAARQISNSTTGAKAAIAGWMGKEVELEGVRGKLDTFIVEPMSAYTAEYYICIHSLREYDEILFYHEGGVDVGDVDAKAVKMQVRSR